MVDEDNIWKQGQKVQGIVDFGAPYFQTIYYELDRTNIVEMLKISSFFTRFVTEGRNNMLMEIGIQRGVKA